MKKKVLYISNIEVPYRNTFFNKLAEECDLTVLYERVKSKNRNDKWTSSEKANFKVDYVDGINIKNEYSFGFRINKYIFSNYDMIILGCYNTPLQIYSNIIMKLFNKKFYINVDGNYFIEGKSIVKKIKRLLLKNAKGVFVAGEKNKERLSKLLDKNNIFCYHFSSLTTEEINQNKKKKIINNDSNYILVVGQYENYKGLDIAVKAAKKLKDIKFKFVGMGKKYVDFVKYVNEEKVENIEIIPFLQKKDLEKVYLNCKALVLPSRKECWGLVINEAASFGIPIVSSDLAGAGEEFLGECYKKYLFSSGDIDDLVSKILLLEKDEKIDDYKKFLLNKSEKYSIEENVREHLKIINGGD